MYKQKKHLFCFLITVVLFLNHGWVLLSPGSPFVPRRGEPFLPGILKTYQISNSPLMHQEKTFMKSRTFYLVMVIFMVAGVSASIATSLAQTERNTDQRDLEIQFASIKDSYYLGEMVYLDFFIKNTSNRDIFHRGLDMASGYLNLYIAFADGNYKKYKQPRVDDRGLGIFKAGATTRFSEGILWNFVPSYSDPKQFEETDIMTDYAFPTPGVYYLRAELYVPSAENPLRSVSNIITIAINEPAGDDMQVWNILKDHGDIAYFIQESSIRVSDKQKQEEFLKNIDRLLNQHPNSIYTPFIRNSRAKYDADMEIIRQEREKRQKLQPPVKN